MTTTPFLGLNTYNTESGSSTTFLTFRLALADEVSNTSKIDAFASSTSASIASIKSNSWNTVNANYISSNYYTADVANITNYYSGMFTNMTFDTENDGYVTLNINDLGIVYLKKIDGDGNLLDFVFNELTPHRNYLFTYDGTQFILIGSTTIDQVSAWGGGIGNFINISASNVLQDSGVPYLDGVTTGSANLVILDEFGRATSASYVPVPITSASVIGMAINSYNSTTGLFTQTTITMTGSSVMSDSSGSVIKHNTSGVTTGTYNNVIVDRFGHVVAGSVVPVPSSISQSTNYYLVAYDASTGTFSKDIVAPSTDNAKNDEYFITSGSSSLLTNYREISAGTNITLDTSNPNKIYINGEAGGGSGGGGIFWNVDGALATGSSLGQYVSTGSLTLSNIYIYVKELGNSGCTICDVNINGSTIFTDQTKRPKIAWNSGCSVAISGVPDITTAIAGDVISWDIDEASTGAIDLAITVVGASGGGSSGHLIKYEGSPFAQRANLNLVGGFKVEDDEPNDATIVSTRLASLNIYANTNFY